MPPLTFSTMRVVPDGLPDHALVDHAWLINEL
jgi:hypothetical protein